MSAGSDARGGGSAGAAAPGRRSAVTLRAVALGLLFSAFFAGFTPYNDYKVAATYIAGTQFPMGALFVELVLVGVVNAALRRWAPRRAFSPGEVVTVWALIAVGSGIPSSGMMRYFLPMIAGPAYLEEGRESVVAHTPGWLNVRDPAAAEALMNGYPTGQERIPWEAWAQPLLAWGAAATCFLVATFCMAAVLRRQWVENERFTFPLVQLPLLLAEEPRPGRRVADVLRSPLLWAAVACVTVVHSLRGLQLLHPSVPGFPLQWGLGDALASPPLDRVAPVDMIVWPLVVGISYLLPAEVCLSLWFFHLFFKFECYVAGVYNWDLQGPVTAYTYKQFHGLQAFGGAVALSLWVAWGARRHLADVWEKATGGPRAAGIDDSREMMSYRAALLGLALSYAGLAAFLLAAGAPPVLVPLSLVTLTLALVVISWVVSQAGLLFMAQPYSSMDVVAATAGTAPFPVPALYTLTRWENMFLYDTREMLAPTVLMGAKAVEGRGHDRDARRLCAAMAASVAVAVGASLYASLWLPYHTGGVNSLGDPFAYQVTARGPLAFFAGVASVPYKGWPGNLLHVAGGFAGVFGLLWARATHGIGLHPIGFLCASVYSMHMLWFSIFVGWACKTVVQRFGGVRLYAALLPVFLGLILGDVLNAAVWIVVGHLTQIGYRITPA